MCLRVLTPHSRHWDACRRSDVRVGRAAPDTRNLARARDNLAAPCGIVGSMTASYEPWASSPASRAVMRANRRRDTRPEMAVRRLVHAAGLRYRVDARPLPDVNRRADLVFSRAKVAVFIDGCYWHGCPAHGTTAKANADYWSAKIARNRERDSETDQLLRDAGWTVVRVWEHEHSETVARRVESLVRSSGPSAQPAKERTASPGEPSG
jgi:DNA mismatch endonuclease (patch repair protein)